MSGRCVAGKEREGSRFATRGRPVSSRPDGEISLIDRRYENGADPEILDIIQIPMAAPCPQSFQTENHLIDANFMAPPIGSGSHNS